MIRVAQAEDGAQLATIYNHYVLNSVITFEELVVSAEEMVKRIQNVSVAGLPWLVAEEHGAIIGYAYASKWKERAAYRHSVESSVYLAPEHTGNGHGTLLYEALFSELKARAVHAILGGIALPNMASVALHEKLGMEKVAHLRETGFKFGRWIDVGYWQLVLQN